MPVNSSLRGKSPIDPNWLQGAEYHRPTAAPINAIQYPLSLLTPGSTRSNSKSTIVAHNAISGRNSAKLWLVLSDKAVRSWEKFTMNFCLRFDYRSSCATPNDWGF